VGTLPRNLRNKPGEALNAECMNIATTIALPEALNANAISTERPTTMNVNTRGEALQQSEVVAPAVAGIEENRANQILQREVRRKGCSRITLRDECGKQEKETNKHEKRTGD
jgi:hypothetical protein